MGEQQDSDQLQAHAPVSERGAKAVNRQPERPARGDVARAGLTCIDIGALSMKIAILAFASATAIACASPALAQQNMNRDQSNQTESQYGSGMHRQFQNDDESRTSGQGNNWSDRDDWRDRNWSDNRDWGRMHRWVQGRMGPMWRMHERMANANEAAHFRFRRGQAAIDVKCPEGESLQTCVNAAGQLLDKIANLRDRNAQGTTNGLGLGSDDSGTSMKPQSGGSLSNGQLNSPSSSGSQSGQ
jgi:Ni/Co efflux regulator RcnB